MYENHINFFKEKGFIITNEAHADFLAKKQGSNFVFMRYTDFYFFKSLSNSINLEVLKEYHEQSKKQASASFKMPKALRLHVPNINSVFITSKPVSNEVKNYLSRHKTSVLGGEQESIFVVDVYNKQLFSAGIEKTKISGEVQLIWGKSKEFKDINGKNRSYYIMKHFTETL